MSKKIVVSIGGSSGSIYAQLLFQRLLEIEDQWDKVGVVMSKNALLNWEIELGTFDKSIYPFDFYEPNNFFAPFASGSAKYDTMIVCPCSMGIIGRIANGVSTDLSTRAADVILKERRKLILVARETPFSNIHLRNMTIISEAGGIICPAVPSFYSNPTSINELVLTVVDRVLDLAGFELNTYRWQED